MAFQAMFDYVEELPPLGQDADCDKLRDYCASKCDGIASAKWSLEACHAECLESVPR